MFEIVCVFKLCKNQFFTKETINKKCVKSVFLLRKNLYEKTKEKIVFRN